MGPPSDATVGIFLTALRNDHRVDRVNHEDREVILVNSRLDESAFRDAVRLAWTATRTPGRGVA